MKAKHLHHKFLPHAIFNAAAFKDFASLHLITRTLNDDSCWEEYESDYTEESLPSHVISFFNDDGSE
jgi:hypothetical protein